MDLTALVCLCRVYILVRLRHCSLTKVVHWSLIQDWLSDLLFKTSFTDRWIKGEATSSDAMVKLLLYYMDCFYTIWTVAQFLWSMAALYSMWWMQRVVNVLSSVEAVVDSLVIFAKRVCAYKNNNFKLAYFACWVDIALLVCRLSLHVVLMS